jgi:glycosyltransferase involved in cell wall biosynthesis
MKHDSRTRRRVRVVHVSLGLAMGGLEKLLVEFARHADRERFALRFVSLGDRGDLAGAIEAAGWPVTALDAGAGLRPGLVFRLARLLGHWGTDVIHTHDDRPLIYGAMAALLARVPRVIHMQHGKNHPFTARKAGYRFAAGLTDRFVCVSDDLAGLAAGLGIAPGRVGRIWNGIDLARFEYRGPKTDGPAVTVARLSPEKDVDTLLQAAALLVREWPGFRLAVAGDGPCLGNLRHRAAQLGLGERVHFLGQVQDVPTLLAGARLFVLPSLSEGISLTILEAMARGLPVVATQVGGNPELVADGETGRLVPPRDPAALAQALLAVGADPAAGRGMGKAGRQRVERDFDVRRMVADYEELYRMRDEPAGLSGRDQPGGSLRTLNGNRK